jgi:hypothetical protein
VERTAKELGLESSLRPTGRPFAPPSPEVAQGRLFPEKES